MDSMMLGGGDCGVADLLMPHHDGLVVAGVKAGMLQQQQQHTSPILITSPS